MRFQAGLLRARPFSCALVFGEKWGEEGAKVLRSGAGWSIFPAPAWEADVAGKDAHGHDRTEACRPVQSGAQRVVFTGTYEHSIDAKNRLAIPSKVRAQIQRSQGLGEGDLFSLYVTLGEGGALCLYTEPAFEKRAAELDDSELDADELLEFERFLFTLAEQVEVDKQGRIRLPESLLKRTGLGQDVVLLGVKDHLEVRDRQTWQDHVEQMLASRPGLLMNPRKAMRRRRPDVA